MTKGSSSRNTKGRAVSSVAALSRRMNSIQSTINGRVFSPSPDPRTFVASPWNQLTVALKYLGSEEGNTRAVLTATDLGSDILVQLGFALTTAIQFRIDSYRLWANSDTSYMTDFNVDIYDVVNTNATDNNSRILQTISDLSGKLTFAKVGYVLPKAQQSTVLNATNTQYLIGMDLPPLTQCELYVRLMWRHTPTMLPPDTFITKHAVLRS